MFGAIDTHVHVIDPDGFPFPADSPGYRPLPEETGTVGQLLSTLDRNGIAGAVLVQPSGYGADNSALLAALGRAPARFRAVVVAPDPDLSALAAIDGVVGVRFNVTDAMGGSIAEPVLRRSLAAAAECGLLAQVLAPTPVLKAILPLLQGASCSVLLDHMARADLAPDDRLVADLADAQNINLKISGPFRSVAGPDYRELDPVVEVLIAAVGAERCVWGSDWPFIKLDGAPKPAYADISAWGRRVAGSDARKVMTETARRLFGFSLPGDG